MSRFFNLESLAVLAACLIACVGGGFAVGLGALQAVGLGLVLSVVAFLFIAPAVLDKLVEVYARGPKIGRALDLAIAARDAAPSARIRNRFIVDVALIQLVRREYQLALEGLEKVKLSLVSSDPAKAVVRGHIAYCLAHLERDLDRALELAQGASKAVPDEAIFTYFVGLVLLKQGKPADAEPLLARSIELDPNPREPFPGERFWALAQARAALGQSVEPAREKAIAAGGVFAEKAQGLGAPSAESVG